MEKMNKNKIKEFWKWFENSLNIINYSKLTEENINILNDKILDIGDFDWEIREGITKKKLFIISSGHDLELLDLSKQIINLAPTLEDWEFLYYKPAKKWNFKLSFIEETGVRKILDVTEWKYVLYKFKDNTYDIEIKADNIMKLSENEKLNIVDIVLTNILGEEIYISYIKDIELINNFEDKIAPFSKPIQDLAKQFENNNIQT